MRARKLVDNFICVWRTCGPASALAYAAAIFTTIPEILRTGTLVPADRKMRGCRYRLQGVEVVLQGDFSQAREMYCRQVYFPTPDFRLRRGGVVVDLGANIGLFSLLAAKAGCHVLAVEAQKGFAREMRALLALQGVDRNVAIEVALVGAARGLLSEAKTLGAASHLEGAIPPSISMAELLARHGIREIDFLKVDIEGSEFALFSENLDWLQHTRRIAMEMHADHGDPAFVVELLAARGFQILDRGDYLFAHRPARSENA
ncbi:MAG: FkbM family methyltransferase [Ramlibacter sp.]|nr:FkbM family methyltransferase [Ramlibacter sp.]